MLHLHAEEQPLPAQAAAVAPRQALRVLHDELTARGLPLTGVLVTRLQAVLMLPDGLVVRCCCGWLIWPTGRLSGCGRPLHTVHSVFDAVGAARRLAQFARSRGWDEAAHLAVGGHACGPADDGLDGLP